MYLHRTTAVDTVIFYLLKVFYPHLTVCLQVVKRFKSHLADRNISVNRFHTTLSTTHLRAFVFPATPWVYFILFLFFRKFDSILQMIEYICLLKEL